LASTAFPELASGNYTLSTNSPSLNAGDGAFITGVTNDLAGNPRVFGVAVDIGAVRNTNQRRHSRENCFHCRSRWKRARGRQPVTFTVLGFSILRKPTVGEINTGSGFVTVATNATYQITTTSNSSTSTVQATLAMNGHQFRVAVPATSYVTPSALLTVRLPQIIYVRAAATGAKTGSSWASAFTNLQQALTLADSCSKFGSPPNLSPVISPDGRLNYRMKAKLPIYGGFAGTETKSRATELTVNQDDPDQRIGTGAVLIMKRRGAARHQGRARWLVLRSSEIAINNYRGAEPLIQNCVFENCATFAILNWECSSTISNCVFTGGKDLAIYNQSSSPRISGCRFTGNQSTFRGAAIYASSSSPTIENCLFEKNSGLLAEQFQLKVHLRP